MDLLLTHGYFLFEDEAERQVMKPYPPLGILYISAYLKSRGHEVDIFDSTFERMQSFREYIMSKRPTIVGLYSNLMTKLNVLEQIRFCRDRGCMIVVGGPDVPEYAREYLRAGADVAVLGEGEATMDELVPLLLKRSSLERVNGIAFVDSEGGFVRTPARELIQDLDTIPLPDRNAIDMRRYISTWKNHHGKGSLSLICARGCPYTCTWCSRSVYGESHRRRSVINVVDEIEILRSTYNPDMLWFADDVFTIQHKWFHEFYAEMKRRNFRIPFECISRADRLNEDILRKMSELGAFRIWFGSESGSQRILDTMQRHVSTETIRSITAQAQRFGIQAGLFVMLGYPGETMADIEETVDHLKRTNADHFLTTIAYPIKGTEFHKQQEAMIQSPGNWESITDRKLRLSGRYSNTFYWFATRYVVNEVRQHKLRSNGTTPVRKFVSTLMKAKIARAGMSLTKGFSS